LPEYLDELAAALDLTCAPDSMASVEKHVGNRFAHGGFGVRDLIAEYQIVRSVVLRVFVDEEHERQPSFSELARLNETIDDSIRRAVDAFIGERDRAHDIFVAILAHDLRGALQSIASAAELMMLRPCDDAMVSRSGCRIVSTVRRMSDLIATLLDFARIQLAGGIPVQRTQLDVRTVLQDVVEEVMLANPTRRIESKVTQAHGNFSGYFDGTRVAQAVTNLMRNAIEHGGDPITLELFDEGDTVCIEVCNEGSIPIDLLPRLFLPFARDRKGGGLGLGLFITSEIARAHGGGCSLRSAVTECTSRSTCGVSTGAPGLTRSRESLHGSGTSRLRPTRTLHRLARTTHPRSIAAR
jgi:signal transduction histidine kinase